MMYPPYGEPVDPAEYRADELERSQKALDAYARIGKAAAVFLMRAYPHVEHSIVLDLTDAATEFYTLPIKAHMEALAAQPIQKGPHPAYVRGITQDYERVCNQIAEAEKALESFDAMPKEVGEAMKAQLEIAILQPLRSRRDEIQKDIDRIMESAGSAD